jgi:PAS domain S-box-containing protein
VQLRDIISAEGDWKAERALFRAMIDQVPDFLWIKDTKSRFVIANRSVSAERGLTPDDLIGKTDFDLHPIERARKFFGDEQRIVVSGEAMIDIEEFTVDVTDEKRWISTSKVPLRDDNNDIIGIIGISRNITERKRAEDQI